MSCRYFIRGNGSDGLWGKLRAREVTAAMVVVVVAMMVVMVVEAVTLVVVVKWNTA